MMGFVEPLAEDMSTSTDPGSVAAREAKDRHAAFIASLQDGFEMMDRSGTILDVNERFAEIVGMPRDQIIGLGPPFPWWFEEGPERERVEEALASVIDGGSGEFDLTFRRPDGQTVDVILNANEVVGSDGERLGLVAIVKDVSDRVAAQAERDELIETLAEERAQLGMVLQRRDERGVAILRLARGSALGVGRGAHILRKGFDEAHHASSGLAPTSRAPPVAPRPAVPLARPSSLEP